MYIILYLYIFVALNIYRCVCLANKVKVANIYKGKVPTSRSANHPLFKRVGPSEMPVGENDLPQAEAKKFLPPKTYIWRANKKGSWHTHTYPHKQHSESWSSHGGDSAKAMWAGILHSSI